MKPCKQFEFDGGDKASHKTFVACASTSISVDRTFLRSYSCFICLKTFGCVIFLSTI